MNCIFFRASAALAAGVLSLVIAQAATAQQGDPAGDAERAVESRRDTDRAATEAQSRLAAGAPVTYQDLLADPDNVDLNLDYARQQISLGNMRSAMSALERILLVAPARSDARLLYALVLLRLDHVAEAERELVAIRDLPEAQPFRAEIDLYLDQARTAQARLKWSLIVSLGGAYDSNRDAVPSKGVLRSIVNGGSLLPTTGTEQDSAFIGSTSMAARYDLNTQEGDELFGSLAFYQREQNHLTRQNLRSLSAEAGYFMPRDWGNVSASVTWINLDLHYETYLRAQGLRLRYDRRLTPLWTVFAENFWQYQDFEAVTNTVRGRAVAPAAADSEGGRNELTLGANWQLLPTQSITAELSQTVKEAKVDHNDFNGLSVAARHNWLLGSGQFLLSSLSLDMQRYEAPDPLIGAITRNDDVIRASVTYGVPVSTAVPLDLPSVIGDIVLTGQVEYTHSISNIENFDYRNWGYQLLATKRLDF